MCKILFIFILLLTSVTFAANNESETKAGIVCKGDQKCDYKDFTDATACFNGNATAVVKQVSKEMKEGKHIWGNKELVKVERESNYEISCSITDNKCAKDECKNDQECIWEFCSSIETVVKCFVDPSEGGVKFKNVANGAQEILKGKTCFYGNVVAAFINLNALIRDDSIGSFSPLKFYKVKNYSYLEVSLYEPKCVEKCIKNKEYSSNKDECKYFDCATKISIKECKN